VVVSTRGASKNDIRTCSSTMYRSAGQGDGLRIELTLNSAWAWAAQNSCAQSSRRIAYTAANIEEAQRMVRWWAVAARLSVAGAIILCCIALAEAQRTPACASLVAGRVPAEVAEVIAEQLRVPLSRVRAESRLVQDLGADELAEVEVVMALDQRFGIRIEDGTARAAGNVRGFTEAVTTLLNRTCGR
jgi:acyl carrier protein